MSFLTKIAPATRVSMTPARASVTAAMRPALFSTSTRRDRGAIESTKDTLKKADRFVSDAAVKGIEKGERAGHKIMDSVGHHSKKAEEQAKKAAKQAERKGQDMSEEAKEASSEMAGKA